MNRNDKEFIAQRIRTQYTEKQATELDSLRALDAKVKRPANVFAYVFGSLSAIMTDIGAIIGITSTMVPGIAIGVIGLLMAVANYPIYKGILNSRKKKYASKIIELSDKILSR